jgi:two-component system response regulator RegX3
MGRQISILVIEDEEAIREGLIDVLVFHKYEVDSAATGPQGLEKALTGKFDLILLDIMLPGMDGYEICDRIRAEDRNQPIIMLTAKTSDDEIIQGLKLGADDYVSKPFSIQQLVLRIEAVLRRSQVGLEQARTIKLGNVEIDTENMKGLNGSEEISFTPRAAPGSANFERRITFKSMGLCSKPRHRDKNGRHPYRQGQAQDRGRSQGT